MPAVAMVGLQQHETEWVRVLVDLLRDEDPVVVEMVRHALLYVREFAHRPAEDQGPEDDRQRQFAHSAKFL